MNKGLQPLNQAGVTVSGTPSVGQVVVAASSATASWAGAPASKYQDSIGCYNFSPSSLRNWRAAYAKAKNAEGTAHIACYGDSTVTGYQGASPLYSSSWPAHLRAMVEAKTGVTKGTGFVRAQATLDAGEDRFSYSGTWSAPGFGPYGRGQGTSTAGTVTIGPITCDRIRVYYAILSNGGTVTSTLDGSAGASFSCLGASAVSSIDYTAAQGSHTLVLTGPGAGAWFYFTGWEAMLNGTTTGIRVSNISDNGQQASGLVSNAAPYHSLPTAITQQAPNLATITFGANEIPGNVAVATFKANLQTAITALRAINSDVILVSHFPLTSPPAATQQLYVDSLYQLCDSNDIAMIDTYRMFGPRGVAVTDNLMTDNQHPNSRGYWAGANMVAAPLVGALVV